MKTCQRIGKEKRLEQVVNLWTETKETVGIKTDVAFAKCLLDRSVNPVYLTSTIRIYFSRITIMIRLRLPNLLFFTCNCGGGIR